VQRICERIVRLKFGGHAPVSTTYQISPEDIHAPVAASIAIVA
jgi:hypothetical protein